MNGSRVYEVPAELIRECGLEAGRPGLRAYRCDDAGAVALPIAGIRGPVIAPHCRGLDVERLRWPLKRIAAGESVPAVPVFREPGAHQAVLLDGAHRLAVSIACGFSEIPCRLVSRKDAEGVYGYPDGQRA